MPIRISGVNLPDNKRIVISLMSIYGIGKSLSSKILGQLRINESLKTKELGPEEEKMLRDYIEEHVQVEGDLRRSVMQDIKHQKDVGTYRGLRHSKNLPVRGQRTKTNSRTVRGNVRKTAGSGRKASAEKT
ncbi:MAG: 30S ribosomal protein S13 [Candidatus Andersenbacteria bacterium RIFCSPHIGHO2_12_FULL_46_9]|nr:MAG: 30S ribosomal protein S13 [Candidatus Andersenbacteria bacterium RIFCSPHIGHO2_02_FULL_46_16]OGY36141.1 MAG: 30S ribosomal protein S13 [Candidatus Andersenbacteria bacterium RIFCSPLOWO2_02_FULL_46_11]OGY38025.1 MAG: 30S ribosomal protein S13 [Candidatus Andersenbacteria bacterium RIFCSPHIGHO2_12_FULL_46_9]OGY42603.1 MAG: 30S ribosomal protein S13 [Candidatus Andersenbacteria bacterium RIFCSPLOWO2_12_FULL_45_8]HBE89788.1 30S ribosomal protein S13 [Candidatus Andersenbacteria bacterium]